ncbi:MAG: NUDIX domain-containing protein [Acidobacteriota bacterium]|nr:NUDIX domain-containing protein [Acidobacteriota bacterium]
MPLPPQTFRAGACAVIVGDDGRVMAFERNQTPVGSWQLPQGGLEPGESPREALFREILEESGIGRELLTLVTEEPRLLAYELPEGFRKRIFGRGQTLYCFVLRFSGSEDAVTLGDCEEFRAWRWIEMAQLAEEVVFFRRPLYREIDRWLRELA